MAKSRFSSSESKVFILCLVLVKRMIPFIVKILDKVVAAMVKMTGFRLVFGGMKAEGHPAVFRHLPDKACSLQQYIGGAFEGPLHAQGFCHMLYLAEVIQGQ